MKSTARFCFVLLTLLGISAVLPTLVHAGLAPPEGDISGNWTLATACTLPAEMSDCVYQGNGSFSQNGNDITGQSAFVFDLVSGPASCPPEMVADVMGTLSGLNFSGTFDFEGTLETTNFNGQVSQDLQMIDGTGAVPVPDGPFQGTTCTWSAEKLLMESNVAVPVLDEVGFALLVLLLLGGGLVMLRRRATFT